MTDTEKRTMIFETMPVKRAVLKQIMPAIAAQMITLIYNLADTYFVGLLGDPRQTAAVTVAGSALLMVTAISNLFGVGGASAISRSLGVKDVTRANEISAVSFWGGALMGILYALVFALFARPILTVCGATEATYELVYGYAKWVIIIGGPFTVLNTLLGNLIRAEGEAAVASFGVALGGVINILLDPIFVLPSMLGLGAIGAGMATAISNLLATVYFFGYLYHKRKSTVIRLSMRYLSTAKKHLGVILSVGFPSALQTTLTVISISASLNFVSRYETEALAGLGIAKKIDQLPLFFTLGTANGMMPFLAYNHAAGNQKRRKQAFRFGCMIALAVTVSCLIVYEIFAPQLTTLFIDDPLTVEYGASFLRLMVIGMPLIAIAYPLVIQFQAMRKVKEAMICSLLRKGLLDIPFLFLLDAIWPLYGCMLVQPVVDFISLFVSFAFYRRIEKQDKSHTEEQKC